MRASPESFTRILEYCALACVISFTSDGKNPARGGVCVLDPTHVRSVPDRGVGTLDLRHDVGDEVILLLLDSGTDLEALQRHDFRARAFQQLLDGDVRLFDERLTGERDFAQGLAQPSL